MNPTITREMRNEQYDRADAAVQSLYRSNGLWLRQVSEAFGLPADQYEDFALLIGDVILGLIPRAKLIPMLMMHLDIDHPTAEKMEAGLSRFLSENLGPAAAHEVPGPVSPAGDPHVASSDIPAPQPVPAPMGNVPDADNTLRDKLVLKPRMTDKIVDRAIPEPGTKPLTREEILRSLAAKRTLQSDVSALRQDTQQ